MDSGLTTAERLCAKLNRLRGDERSELALMFRDLAFADNANDIEAISDAIRMTLDGPKQEGGEHG